MKFIIFVLFISLFFACKKDEEKYIAKVNNKGIERDKFSQLYEKRFKNAKLSPKQQYLFKSRLLDNLITEEILTSKAKELDISVSDDEVNKEIQKIKSRYSDPKQFQEILKQSGFTEADLTDMYKKQLAIRELIDKEISNQIQIPEEEAKKYYKENKKQYDVTAQVQASHILLKLPKDKKEKNTDKNLKNKLSKIRKDILAGKITFEDAAKKYSDCPSKAKGGDLGLFGKGNMVKEFENIAFASKIGKISKPFKTTFGYHILKVTKKQKPHQKTFKEVKDSIIATLKNQQKRTKIKEYIENLKKNSTIVRYLKEPAESQTVAQNAPEAPTMKETKESKPAVEPEKEEPKKAKPAKTKTKGK